MNGIRCNEGGKDICDFCRKETEPEFLMAISTPNHKTHREALIVCTACLCKAFSNSLVTMEYPHEVTLLLAKELGFNARKKDDGSWELIRKEKKDGISVVEPKKQASTKGRTKSS